MCCHVFSRGGAMYAHYTCINCMYLRMHTQNIGIQNNYSYGADIHSMLSAIADGGEPPEVEDTFL